MTSGDGAGHSGSMAVVFHDLLLLVHPAFLLTSAPLFPLTLAYNVDGTGIWCKLIVERDYVASLAKGKVTDGIQHYDSPAGWCIWVYIHWCCLFLLTFSLLLVGWSGVGKEKGSKEGK